jgi:hypothetical protein
MGDVVFIDKTDKDGRMGELKDRIVVIRGPMTADEVKLISDVVSSFREYRFDIAEGAIVEVGVQVTPGRIVRAPIGRFFDFIRRGWFDAKNWPEGL